jgi:formiminoglutamate deiminase
MGTTSLWFETALLADGWSKGVRLTVLNGLVSKLEIGVTPGPADERHAIGVPGLPNLHSHAFQRGMAGLAETRDAVGDDFWTWREVMYRFVDRLSPEDVSAIAAQAYTEMLECGFTRVGEFHYLHHDLDGFPYGNLAEMAAAIAEAAGITGIGLTLLPVFYAHGGFGGLPPGSVQRRFLHDTTGFTRLVGATRKTLARLPDAVLGIAPHSLRATTLKELTEILPLAEGGPVHIHVAEQLREVEDCEQWSGQRPVDWLLDNAPIDDHWCLVHATHMTDKEARRLAASGAIAGLCPITEANLGDGVFPAEVFLNSGGKFGVGSDSNVLINAAEELRLLEYGQRLTRRKRGLFATSTRPSAGASLFQAALAGGAKAVGASCEIAPGFPLDLVSLKSDHPSLEGRTGDAILDGWIFAARYGVVDIVWRRGEKVVVDGRHVSGDAITSRYRSVIARFLSM